MVTKWLRLSKLKWKKKHADGKHLSQWEPSRYQGLSEQYHQGQVYRALLNGLKLRNSPENISYSPFPLWLTKLCYMHWGGGKCTLLSTGSGFAGQIFTRELPRVDSVNFSANTRQEFSLDSFYKLCLFQKQKQSKHSAILHSPIYCTCSYITLAPIVHSVLMSTLIFWSKTVNSSFIPNFTHFFQVWAGFHLFSQLYLLLTKACFSKIRQIFSYIWLLSEENFIEKNLSKRPITINYLVVTSGLSYKGSFASLVHSQKMSEFSLKSSLGCCSI